MAKTEFGQNLSSTHANSVYLLKTEDDTIVGVLSLENGLDTNKHIVDLQEYIYTISDVVGIVGESDPNAKVYVNTNIIANGDSRKVAIEKLDAQVGQNVTDIASLFATVAELQQGEFRIKSYVDDAAYEADKGAPPYTDYTAIYYNTTSGLMRYYDGVSAAWKEVGTSAIGEHESLGNGNGVNTDFNISLLPLSESSIIVFKNGVLVPEAEYTFSNPTITFLTAPPAGSQIDVWYLTEGTPSVVVAVGGTIRIGYLDINSTDITNKNATLPAIPLVANEILIDVIGGSSQRYALDFTIIGSTIDWNGLNLEAELVDGSALRYFYYS